MGGGSFFILAPSYGEAEIGRDGGGLVGGSPNSNEKKRVRAEDTPKKR